MRLAAALELFGLTPKELDGLGVDELRSRWRRMAKNQHPDKGGGTRTTHDTWLRFMEAYEVLKGYVGEKREDLGVEWGLFREILDTMLGKIRERMARPVPVLTPRDYAVVEIGDLSGAAVEGGQYKFTLPVRRPLRDAKSGAALGVVECEMTVVVPMGVGETYVLEGCGDYDVSGGVIHDLVLGFR